MERVDRPPGVRARVVPAVLFVGTVALGITVRTQAGLLGPFAAKVLGVVLYSTMMVWIVEFLRPSWRMTRVCAVALAACWALEALQASGASAWVVRRVPLARWVLGEVFSWLDLVWYAVGVGVAACIHGLGNVLIRGRARTG